MKIQAVYTGWVWGMSDMDSEGDQHFAVDMQGAKLPVNIWSKLTEGIFGMTDIIDLSN